jgi:hypothetical protein
METDNEWYTLCSDNKILLEHLEDSNDFKITFDVLEKYENIVEIIHAHKLFELVFELNKEIILNYSEKINSKTNVNSVIITISTKNLPSIEDNSKEASIYFNYSIKEDNKLGCTTLYSSSIDKPIDTNKNHIYLCNFDLQLINKKTSSQIIINYSLTDEINKVSHKFISLHFKNIFYKLKLYFD